MVEDTLAVLAAYWADKHPDKADVQAAMAYLPAMEVALPEATGHQPVIIHMLGTPGSGKTALANALLPRLADLGQTFYRNDHDRVMEALPPYQDDIETLGAEAAFERWHIPARATSYALMERIRALQVSVLFDHGASDPRHVDLLLDFERHGYRVKMVYPQVTLETALKRLKKRMEQPGARYTPEEMVRERYAVLATLADEYAKHFDIIRLDNSGRLSESLLDNAAKKILG